MKHKLRLVKFGTLENKAGELLVIDPCYLADQSIMEAVLDQGDPMVLELEYLREMQRRLEEVAERKKAGKPAKKVDLGQVQRQFAKKPSFRPPYMFQGNGFVIFGTGADGAYSIQGNHTDADFTISLNETESELPKLGEFCLDTANVAIIDPTQIRLSRSNLSGNLYCRLGCAQPGKYGMHFTRAGNFRAYKRTPMKDLFRRAF